MIRTLLLDGSPDEGELFKLMLEKAGCEVEVISDGRKGIAFIKEKGHLLNLVVALKELPCVSGEEVLEMACAVNSDVKTIIVTSSPFQNVVSGLQKKFGYVLHKGQPIGLRDVQAAVNAVFS